MVGNSKSKMRKSREPRNTRNTRKEKEGNDPSSIFFRVVRVFRGSSLFLMVQAAVVTVLLFALPSMTFAVELAPPSNLVVKDRPNDAGNGLIVTWALSLDDQPQLQPKRVIQYEVWRIHEPGEWNSIAKIPAGSTQLEDTNCEPGKPYRYRVIALGPDDAASMSAETAEASQPTMHWIDRRR